ncbi:hypothetical protein FNJ84_19000 [Paracoccus sp. M683]|uniref:enolase C-terminal domain-like protein n=1 Tax=Paracoccus sp. M683 TaxID=2594268 RepID=UPI0011804331|nr:enolase C-terminal domain-like protein [Paracoccus sp. M683]TRW94584.1 hypothetical protein FNJ84_19000 [Paracoccus sp. M683]
MTEASQIVRAELYAVALEYRAPVEWTTGGVETRSAHVIIRAWNRAGQEGAAEVVCRPAWNGISQQGFVQLFRDVAWPVISSSGFRAGDIGRIRDVSALGAGLDTLLDDFRHDHAAFVTGGAVGPAIAVLTRATAAEMAGAAVRAVADGFGIIKVKLGQGLVRDAEILSSIRQAVGDATRLCADANGAYGAAQLSEVVALAQQYDLRFVEDPIAIVPLAEPVAATSGQAIPILVDRHCDGILAARQFAELGQIDIAAKPARVGLNAARQMLDTVAARGGRAVIGLFGETDIGALAQLRLAAQASAETLWGVEASFHDILDGRLLQFDLPVAGGGYAMPPVLHLAGAIDWARVSAISSGRTVLEV